MITLLNKFDDNYIIQEKDVLEIINYYINENNLKDYLNDVIFSNHSKYIGCYDLKTNQIIFNDEKILSFCYRKYDLVHNKFFIDENSYTYFLNYYYLYIIFHELSHVMQKANYEKELMKNDNINSYLYELCRKMHYGNQAFYSKNHNLFPMEIDANNNGFLKAYQLMMYTKLPKKELRIMYLQYLFSLLENYTLINPYRVMTPVDKLSKINALIDINEISCLLHKSKLSKIERINLGLDITPKEYHRIEKEKEKILLRK